MKYIIYRFPDVLEFDDDDIHSGTRMTAMQTVRRILAPERG